MTVPKSKRAVAEYEFYNNALKIRERVNEWLLRDFGIKPHIRDLGFLQKRNRLSDEDKKLLEDIFDRNGLGDRIAEDYPAWWIAERRRNIDKLCSEMMRLIVSAFNIYPTSTHEWEDRRTIQNHTIAAVYSLLEELQFTCLALHRAAGADVNAFLPVVELCDNEIALLKGWRKQGNAIRNAILKKEQKALKKIQDRLA